MEQQSHECKVDYQKNGGTVRWSRTITCATCTTKWRMARQGSRKEVVRNLTDHQFSSETLVEYILIRANDKSRVHQFGQKTLEAIFLACALRAGGR